MAVAPAAPSAPGRYKRLIPGHVGHQPPGFIIVNQRTPGYRDHTIRPCFAKTSAAAAVLARFRLKFPFIPEIRQGIGAILGYKYHIAPTAAIPSIRSTGSHIFFPMEADGTIAAVSSFNLYNSLINKHNV